MPRLWRLLARSLLAVGLLLGCCSRASKPSARSETTEIALWPGVAPGSEGLALKEVVSERSLNPKQHDRAITGISKPSLTGYLPEHPNGSALIVAVGGAYVREAWDKEGVDTARLFVSKGVTVFLLKYRLPGEGHQHSSDVPLEDAQRAVRLVRARAESFHVDAARIGVMGFSAGGHLASLLGRAVTRANPATLLILAGDDAAVPPENSLRYYRALVTAGVSAELHVYERGGHGFALRSPPGSAVDGWAELASKWIRRRGS